MQIVNQEKTECELTFVKRLSHWTERGLSRRDLLENYIIATAFRANWDGIDSGRVRSYAAVLFNISTKD